MSITWGGTALPLVDVTGDAVTDHAATVLLAYFKAFLNAYAPTAFNAAFKLPAGAQVPVLRAYVADPEAPETEFNEDALPSLWLFRDTGVGETGWDDEYIATDWPVETDKWKLLWVFPAGVQQQQQLRDPFVSGLTKLLRMALKRGRDPVFQLGTDTDITALDVAALPTSLKTSVASSAAPQTYTGGAINGSIGLGAIKPARAPTVTVNPGAFHNVFVPGSKVRFTGTNTLGSVIVSTITFPAGPDVTPGTYAGDYDLSSVTQIAVDAQNNSNGTLTFGTAARAGLGSVVLRQAGLVSCVMTAWKKRQVTIGVAEPTTARHYYALEVSLTTMEKLEEDIADSANPLNQVAPPSGADVSFRREDNTEIEVARY